MSEQAMYEIAQRRIDARNRRWTFWAVDLAVLVLALAALILLSSTPYVELAAAVFLGWGGIFTMHTIIAALAESRAGSIENEVARLREVAELYGEKPKREERGTSRLELTDDGEIVETDNWDDEVNYAQRN